MIITQKKNHNERKLDCEHVSYNISAYSMLYIPELAMALHLEI